jgi:hypothetical protein
MSGEFGTDPKLPGTLGTDPKLPGTLGTDPKLPGTLGDNRGWWDDRGKWLGSCSGGGSAVQTVLDGVRQMGGLMIVAFVTPITASRGSGTSATSVRFEALRDELKNRQAERSQQARRGQQPRKSKP